MEISQLTKDRLIGSIPILKYPLHAYTRSPISSIPLHFMRNCPEYLSGNSFLRIEFQMRLQAFFA